MKSINYLFSIFSTAFPGIGSKAEANTKGGVEGVGATPSSSASQAGEWSGRGAVVGPDPGAAPSPQMREDPRHRRLQTQASPGNAWVAILNRKHDVILINSY